MSNLVQDAYLFFAFDDLHAFDGMLVRWSAPLKLICQIERRSFNTYPAYLPT